MMTRRRILFHTSLCLLACALVATGASAQSIVVPSSLKTLEGNSNSDFPFDISAYGFLSQRFQQVYAASEFASAGGPVWISQIAFRPDAQWCMPFSATIPNVQINLSATTPGPDALSLTFGANVGANDTVVYSGPLALAIACAGPVLGPKDFELKIPLTTPFLYDPSKGNLLMDVRTSVPPDQPYGVPFDTQAQVGDSVSYLYTYSFQADAVMATEGFDGGGFSFGLVTEFAVAVAAPPDQPEPAVALNVPVDIKPQGCPNPWNLKSEGVLPVAILGTKDFDVTTVDPETIRLEGVPPLRFALGDAGTPYAGTIPEPASATACTAKGPDGIQDLTLKFDSSALRAALGHDPADGEAFVFTLTAKLKPAAGGTDIQGQDVVLILNKGKK